MASMCFSLLSYVLPMPLFLCQKSAIPSSLGFQENRERHLTRSHRTCHWAGSAGSLLQTSQVSAGSVSYILKIILSSPWQFNFFFFNTSTVSRLCLGSHVFTISHSGAAQKSLTNLGWQPSSPVTDARLTEQRFALLQAGTWLQRDQQWQRGCRLAS